MTGDAGDALVLRTVERNGCVVLIASGEIDYLNAAGLRDAVRAADSDCVVLDVTEVTYVDSTGLAMLLAGDQYVRERGGRLGIAGAGEQLSRLLHTTNLDLRLSMYSDVAAAIDSRSE